MRILCRYGWLHSPLFEELHMPLLHFNMIAMSIACISLLVGFSYRDSRWGAGFMFLGVLTLMGVIVYDIQVLSTHP